jgi:vacuolar iron transporter family protein
MVRQRPRTGHPEYPVDLGHRHRARTVGHSERRVGLARMASANGLSPEDRRTSKRINLLSRMVSRLRGRTWRVVPHPGPVTEQAAGGRSGALRAAIFGVNDGLVSNLSLIFGVAGAGVDNDVVIVAGVAGLVAGAFSMAAGEYISVRTQREVYERLIHLEAHEIGSDPEIERQELAEIYVRKGLSRELSERLATELMRDPETALETHAREELGLDREGLGSPFAAAGSSFVTFAVGAFVPLIPFLVSSGTPAVVASAILSGLALFGVGAAMSYLTERPWLLSGLRMLAVGGSAAAVTFLVGELLNVSVLS